MRLTEEKQGNVDEMLGSIKSQAGRPDDCSLLQLDYRPEPAPDFHLTPEPFWREVYSSFKQKNYTGTIRKIRSKYTAKTAPTRVLFLWSNCLFELGQYHRAFLIGRLYLSRNPGDEAAVYLMAHNLQISGRRTEARAFLEALLLRRPGHKRYQSALTELIKKKRTGRGKQRANRRNYPSSRRLLKEGQGQSMTEEPLTENSVYG